jgi:phage replication O-like protein O
MANPQVEKGHTRIANEILEQIAKTVLSGTKYRIVIAVWRYTYGFQRKKHKMSAAFLANAINSDRSHVYKELTELEEQKILLIHREGPGKSYEISFNKNYEEWTSCIPKKEKKDAAPPPSPPKKKRKSQKRQYDENNLYYRMALHFHNRVSAVAEAEGLGHLIANSDLQKWADDMRKLVEINKVADMKTEEGKRFMKDVMNWTTSDPFWKVNVLSAKKFRDKFAELALKMKASQSSYSAKQQVKPKDPRDKEIAINQWIAAGRDPDEFSWDE